jgi:hypothetical protein
MRLAPLFLALFLAACADTGRAFVSVPFAARGTGVTSATIDGFTVTLTRADVSVGPIYFCATALASAELCDDALLERTDTRVVNGLDATEQAFGVLEGVSGNVRSTAYDFGISYFLTQAEAAPTEGAVEGHSAVLEGEATNGVDTFAFRIEVDVIPQTAGDTAIHGARTDAVIDGIGDSATMVVDPMAWLGAVDFDALLALPHGVGTPVLVQRGVAGHDAVVLGMTSFAPPTFEWGE